MACLFAATLAIAGCSRGPSLDPVDWWHNLEGGPIADARPPPPNADAPYPNLRTVPPKPMPTDSKIRTQIASGLVADRANADYAASLAPIAPPAPPQLRPLPVAAKPDTGDDSLSSASLEAASAQPRSDSAPANSRPVAAPSTVPPPPALPAGSPLAGALPASATQSAMNQTGILQPGPTQSASDPIAVAMPPIPELPPLAPSLGGIPAITAPTPPPPTPPKPSAVAGPFNPGPVVSVGFAHGSAEVPSSAREPLKGLARRRGPAVVAVTGFGESAAADPASQAAALPLALDRAEAVAASLRAAGVPPKYIRIDAQAMGQGGVASLVPVSAPVSAPLIAGVAGSAAARADGSPVSLLSDPH